MKNNIPFCIVLMAAVLLSGCKKGESHEPTEQQPVRVKTICAAASDISSTRTYSGTVEESSATSLSFPVAGTISAVNVSPGQFVSKGQLVASLDQTTLKNAWEISKSTLAQAQDAYDRMKMLHDSNSLPDMQWVDVQNTLKQAQSGEAIARKAMADASLYAPISGYVAEKFAEPGMTVAPIEPIVKIVKINPVKISVSIPENEISTVKDGQEAEITVAAVDGAKYHGKVTEKGVSANSLSRAYQVKIAIDNPEGKLLPGMICDVDLMSETPRQAIVLPLQAVLLDAANSNFVWLASGGKAAKRIVETDGMTDAGIIVVSGIAAGDSIIVEGQQKVSQGTPIDVLK